MDVRAPSLASCHVPKNVFELRNRYAELSVDLMNFQIKMR